MAASFGLAPLRAWDDFFPGADRFARPDTRDWAKWHDRVVHNLLYYQTNYLAVAVAFFLAVSFLNPLGTHVGTAALFLGATRAEALKAAFQELRRRYPRGSVLAAIALSYRLMSVLRAVLLFAAGVSFPLVLALAHASFRRRGDAKNKPGNDKVREEELRRSPMGVLLENLYGFIQVCGYF